jgi:hypothetical protein
MPPDGGTWEGRPMVGGQRANAGNEADTPAPCRLERRAISGQTVTTRWRFRSASRGILGRPGVWPSERAYRERLVTIRLRMMMGCSPWMSARGRSPDSWSSPTATYSAGGWAEGNPELPRYR